MSWYDDAKDESKREGFIARHGYEYSSVTFAFSRNEAVSYAESHWDNPDTDNYPLEADNDCTNFVSQCWTHAGIPVSEDWFCDRVEGYGFIKTSSWVDAEEFGNYMESRGYCWISYNSLDANLGDIIQFYNSVHGWHHSAIITKKDENGDLAYCAHSDSNHDKDLTKFYREHPDEKLRFLCANNAY